jgi:hypothetical protein
MEDLHEEKLLTSGIIVKILEKERAFVKFVSNFVEMGTVFHQKRMI